MAEMQLMPQPVPETSLVVRTAERYGIEPAKLLTTLKATAFRTDKGVSNEQMMSLLIVAERHRLDPFTKQIYAYPDRHGGIVPVVGIDGWLHIINTHPMFDGMETRWDDKQGAMTCTIQRKDRTHPIIVTEYLAECRRPTEVWKTMPLRMMRHKATMQCARYAFGFSGIFDEDEATDIMRGSVPRAVYKPEPTPSNAQRFTQMAEVVPAVEPEPAAPEPAPPEPTLEHFITEVEKADDTFVAEMVLEEAREFLSDEEMSTLAATFNARFNGDGE
jgi:phage recombination protein Bet